MHKDWILLHFIQTLFKTKSQSNIRKGKWVAQLADYISYCYLNNWISTATQTFLQFSFIETIEKENIWIHGKSYTFIVWENKTCRQCEKGCSLWIKSIKNALGKVKFFNPSKIKIHYLRNSDCHKLSHIISLTEWCSADKLS